MPFKQRLSLLYKFYKIEAIIEAMEKGKIMITIGIITTDQEENDPSLKVFKSFEEEYNFKLKVINPLVDEVVLHPEVNVFYPRITGKNKKSIERQYKFYKDTALLNKVPYIGDLDEISLLKDKFYQVKKANKFLKVPKTFLISEENIDEVCEKLAFPLVLKATHSFGGSDVFLKKSKEEILAHLKENNDRKYIAQEFIDIEGEISDLRVYIIGGEVSGGFKRRVIDENEFRTNTSLGTAKSWFVPCPEEEISNKAKKFAESIGMKIIAVDFLRRKNEYIFMETNDAFSVNIKSDYNKTIARNILKYLLDKAQGSVS